MIDVLPDEVLLEAPTHIPLQSVAACEAGPVLEAYLEVVSVSSCVSEVAIRRLCVAKFSPNRTSLRSQDTRGAHKCLAIRADRHTRQARSAPSGEF